MPKRFITKITDDPTARPLMPGETLPLRKLSDMNKENTIGNNIPQTAKGTQVLNFFGKHKIFPGINYTGAVYAFNPADWAGILFLRSANSLRIDNVRSGRFYLDLGGSWQLTDLPTGIYTEAFDVPVYFTFGILRSNREVDDPPALLFEPYFSSFIGNIEHRQSSFGGWAFRFGQGIEGTYQRLYNLLDTIPNRGVDDFGNPNFLVSPEQITQEQLDKILTDGSVLSFGVFYDDDTVFGQPYAEYFASNVVNMEFSYNPSFTYTGIQAS